MSVSNFSELRLHHHHDIEVVLYGHPSDPVNVAIECETCSEVLLDFDRYEQCSLSWCSEPYYSTFEDGGTEIDLCEHHYDRLAR